MDPTARVQTVMRDVSNAESRLTRAVATGKSDDGLIAVTITGNGKVKSLEINGADLGLNDEQASKVGESIAQAIEAALAKQGRRVKRELEKINI